METPSEAKITDELPILEHVSEVADLLEDNGPEIEDVLYEDRVNVNDFYV